MNHLTTYSGHGIPALFDEDFFRPFFFGGSAGSFQVNLKDEGERYLLEAELPGLKNEDIQIDVEDGTLTISASWDNESSGNYLISERRFGRVQRSFSLDNVREDGITAEYENGLLLIRLPKSENVRRSSRRIELN